MKTDRELLDLAAKAAQLPECGWMGPAFMYVKDNNVWWGAGGEKTNKIAREFAGDGADVAAAIRRAIVRAAAEVGKAMP